MPKMKYYDTVSSTWKSLDAANADTLGGNLPAAFATSGHNHSGIYQPAGTYDNYSKWTLKANTEATGIDITTGVVMDIKGSGSTSVARSGSTLTISSTNTTYGVFTSTVNGLAPLSGGGTTKYLRADGAWVVPPDTNTDTTYTNGSGLSLTGNVFAAKAVATATLVANQGEIGIDATNGLYVKLGTDAKTASAGNHTHANDHTRSHAMTSTSDHSASIWKMFYSNGSGQIVELGLGASGEVLKSNGVTAAPSWAADIDGNNYLTAVTGSGNGTMTFARSGLANLTLDTSHSHSIVTNATGDVNSKIIIGGTAPTGAANTIWIDLA
jgi:hypothetical protein